MLARLSLVIGAYAFASGLAHATGPASTGGQLSMILTAGLQGATLPSNSRGLGKGLSRGLGKGHGRGKGVSVAGVSYHCLGASKQINQGSPSFSGLADSIVLDAGGQTVTLEGAATSDLVVDGETMIPTHMAAASIKTDGLTVQTFDTCGTSAGSILNATVTGTDLTDSGTSGVTYVEFIFDYHATLEGSGNNFSAYTETTLNVPGFQGASFKVSADGTLIKAPPGLAVTDLSVRNKGFLYEVKGKWTVGGVLFYGPGVTNVVQTTFQANGEVTGLDVKGSKMIAGFASAAADNTLTYEIVSLDPNVAFSFVPAEAAGDDTTEDVAP
jgi:hypothetical protein